MKNKKLALMAVASMMATTTVLAQEPTVFSPNGINFGGAQSATVATGSNITPNQVANTTNNKVGEPGNLVVGQSNIVENTSNSASVLGNQNYVAKDAKDANVFGDANIAVGNLVQIAGDNNMVNGYNSQAFGQNNLIGDNFTVATNVQDRRPANMNFADGATAVGSANMVMAGNSITVGNNNKVGLDSSSSLTENNGQVATINGMEANMNAVTVGIDNTNKGDDNTVVGQYNSVTDSQESVAVGFTNTVTNRYNTAVGNNNKVSGFASVGIGYNTEVKQDNSVAIGSNAKTQDVVKTKTMDVNGKTYSVAGNPVGTVSVGDATKERTITNVAAGRISSFSTDAINGSQLQNVIESVNAVGQAVTTNKQHIAGNMTNIAQNKGDIKDIKDTLTKGYTFTGDTGTTGTKQLGSTIGITGDENIITTANTNGVQATLNKDLSVNTITLGGGTQRTILTSYGMAIKDGPMISKNGIDAGNKVIKNVAPGVKGTDAVNVNQLHDTVNQATEGIREGIDNVQHEVHSLDNKLEHGIAGVAALASLHPLDFNPDDKLSFSAGVGNYGSATAVAVGAFYKPNEDLMFSVGATMGDKRNIVNGSVSWKFGQGQRVSTTRVSMAKEILDLRKQNEDLQNQINDLKNMISGFMGLDTTKKTDFPDVPANHWAYEYVATLAGNGILEGYPDGTFKGDQAMTRYEYATIVYKALAKGVSKDDPNMARSIKEFSPELKEVASRIRVDRISGNDNDRYKVERVHVVNELTDNVLKDIYGSDITK